MLLSGICPPCPEKSIQKCICGKNKELRDCAEPIWKCNEVGQLKHTTYHVHMNKGLILYDQRIILVYLKFSIFLYLDLWKGVRMWKSYL